MILRSNRSQTPAELRETIDALEQIVESYEGTMDAQDLALTTAHQKITYVIGFIARTMNTPTEVDFDGILIYLDSIRDIIEAPRNLP